METGQIVLSRQLPKTGQFTSYRAGDDGIYQAGWWRGRQKPRNKTRFISKTIAGDDVVTDRATGLMWAADGNAAGCNNGNAISWNNGIDYANALDFAGFTDWRIPNINELLSLVNYNLTNPSIKVSIFPNTALGKYWSSTTSIGSQTHAWYVEFIESYTYYDIKVVTRYLRCVRGGL